MAYLRIKKVKRYRYYYIMRSVRKGGKVASRVLEYLGRDPDPQRLKRAMQYWVVRPKVKPKGAKR